MGLSHQIVPLALVALPDSQRRTTSAQTRLSSTLFWALPLPALVQVVSGALTCVRIHVAAGLASPRPSHACLIHQHGCASRCARD
jgi:hypothetical protein